MGYFVIIVKTLSLWLISNNELIDFNTCGDGSSHSSEMFSNFSKSKKEMIDIL